MADAYELYKPLRNHLLKVGLIESLGVIRAYMQHLQFGTSLPDDIEVPTWFLQASRLGKHVFEWELDVLAREILVNADEGGPSDAKHTLRRWSYFANAVNKLKDFENALVETYPEGSILGELHRIAHRQFPWQRRPNAGWMGRYFEIFGQPPLNAILERKIGLGARDLYLMGLGITGAYVDQFALYYPPKIQVGGLTRDKLDRFLAHFAVGISELRDRARAGQELNENYAYVLNPLRIHPLVRLELRGRPALIAPIPTFLIWRFTEGVYYEVVNEPDFGEAYGEAFQRYTGTVVSKTNPGSLKRYPEAEYYVGKNRHDSVDWVVEDESGFLFVESKTKRLRLRAKTEIRSIEVLEEELDKLAGFIIQIYKTIEDYRSGLYRHVPLMAEKPIFPIVLTLEEWYPFGPKIQEALEERVRKKCEVTQVPLERLAEMPYSICSAPDFERLMQVVGMRSVAEVMRAKTVDPERRRWLMGVFLSDRFPDEYGRTKEVFGDVLDELTAGLVEVEESG